MRTSGPAASEAGAILSIDLDALAANWHQLRERANGATCAAVVKADAYGIGLTPAASALRQAGCDTFFVAQVDEAVQLREACPEAIIHVLNGLRESAAPTLAGLRLRPVIGSRAELTDWVALARRQGEALPYALHVDTGMNRLGLSLAEARTLAAEGFPDNLMPSLLMSHFVSAEVPDDPVTARQIADFATVRALFPEVPASLCNSSGIFLPDAPVCDLVRPGYALYGGNPTPGRPNVMRPVVRLEAPILQIREVPDGASAGYNAQWTARGPRRLATIGVGYADGYPRGAGGTDAKRLAGLPMGEALVAGIVCPFAGRVSMDLIVIDVTDVPAGAARRGALVTLIGDALDLDRVGHNAGTIGYEVLTGLGQRYARLYAGG